MIRRLIAGVVIAAGLFSIAVGVQRWFDARAAESVVDSLMQAVTSGDRSRALPLLTLQLRKMMELPSGTESQRPHWKKQTGISYTITGVSIAGDEAIANVDVDKRGFVLKPVIHLHRGTTARWKIQRIENLAIDPRYLQQRRDYERRQGQELADRLQKALKNRPGVTIERVSFTEETPPR